MYKQTFSLIALIIALASTSVRAQMADRLTERPTPTTGSAGDDAVFVTRSMANRLHLNEGQLLKLLPLNRIKLAGLTSINRDYKSDEITRNAKAAELEAQYEQECSRILTPSQLSHLQQQNGQPATAPANSGNGLG